ncbi:MAG: autotransporter-associated beta strand repeat-containing protein [Verrucomicrobiota bacterium]
MLSLPGGTTTVNISGLPSTGTYTLIQYGSFSGDLATLAVPTGYVVTNNTATKTIQLIKTRAPAALTWQGDGSGNVWDTGTTANWLQAGTNQIFSTGDSVTFNDSGSTAPAITLSGTIQPAATAVTGSQSYDFTGSGISSGTLTKSGSGTLILENNNTYSGATIISGGAVQVGNLSGASGGTAGSLGSGVVTNNASLVYSRADAATLATPIYGSGTVTISSGTIAAPGSNYYSGTTFINGGIGLLQNSAGFGDTNGGITVASGGQLYMVANVDVGPKALMLAGIGPDGNGALRKGFAGPTTFYGPVTLTADTLLNVDGGATLTFAHTNGVNGVSANANLTFAGGGTGVIPNPLALGSGGLTVSGGTWTIAPSNNFSGLTTINGGTLRISGAKSLGLVPAVFNPSQVTMNGGAFGASTNVTLNDGKIGITINGNSSLSIPTGVTLTISNEISGAANLTKVGAGTVVLAGSNSFSGQLYIDTFINYLDGSDGMTVIANTAALANVPAVLGTPYIFMNNNTAASSTLGLDGSTGSVNIAPDIFLRGRGVAVANIRNLAGNNTVSGGITISTGGGMYIQSDIGTLTLVQPFPYIGDAAIGSARSLTFTGAGNIVLPGGIQNANGFAVNVTKTGTGALVLTGTNSSTGTTTVSGGLFTGTGLVLGAVSVPAGGSIGAGNTNSIGTLTISNSLTLAGTTLVKLHKTATTNDKFAGLTSVTYGGALVVTNFGGTLNIGDTFPLFTASATSSNFTSIVNQTGNSSIGFTFNPTTGVLSVVTGVPSTPTNLTYNVTGNTISLSWPANYLGWVLQTQTNALSIGLNTNWYDWPGSASVTATNIAINPASPTVFFRLRYP